MDLVTLVTVCALGVEPKLMHALVWHHSGGDPRSFSLPGDPDRRTNSTMQNAIREVGTLGADGATVRIGLAGLPVDAPSVPGSGPISPLPTSLQRPSRRAMRRTSRCRTRAASRPPTSHPMRSPLVRGPLQQTPSSRRKIASAAGRAPCSRQSRSRPTARGAHEGTIRMQIEHGLPTRQMRFR